MAPDAPGAPFRVLMQRLGELANYNGHVDPEGVEAAKASILKDHPDEVDAFRQIFDLLDGRQMGEQNRSPVRLKKITDAIALLATHAREAEEQARSKPEPDVEGEGNDPPEGDYSPDPSDFEPPEGAELIIVEDIGLSAQDVPEAVDPTKEQMTRAREDGVDLKWALPNGWRRYPDNDGFDHLSWIGTIEKGAVIDRYGGELDEDCEIDDTGRYSSPKGTPFSARVLPKNQEFNDLYVAYEVVKPIEGVRIGKAVPWFDQPGGGLQYLLPMRINELRRRGFIKPIEVKNGKD